MEFVFAGWLSRPRARAAARSMRIDPEKPGLFALLRGEGEPVMRVIAWAGVFILLPLFIAGGLSALGF
jgi:hypothetical protein